MYPAAVRDRTFSNCAFTKNPSFSLAFCETVRSLKLGIVSANIPTCPSGLSTGVIAFNHVHISRPSSYATISVFDPFKSFNFLFGLHGSQCLIFGKFLGPGYELTARYSFATFALVKREWRGKILKKRLRSKIHTGVTLVPRKKAMILTETN